MSCWGGAEGARALLLLLLLMLLMRARVRARARLTQRTMRKRVNFILGGR